MSVRHLAILAAATSLGGACNLVKLSDDIAQAHCDSDADCEVLNERDGDAFDACEPWQCVAKTRYCEKGPLDADRDGFSPASVTRGGDEEMCVAEVSKQDCDDRDDARAPDLDETCDDRDNDCDGYADEGALDAPTDTVVTLGAAPVAASYAYDSASGTVAIGYATEESAGTVPGIAFVSEGLAESTTPVDFAGVNRAPRVAVAALSGGRFAVAMYATSGKKRVVAGIVDASDAGGTSTQPSADALGLMCAEREACATDADAPTPATGGIGLSAFGDHVLVAYARAAEGTPTCGELVGAADAAPVFANLLLDRGAAGLEERTTTALELGTTRDPDSNPAVIGLDGLGFDPDRAGWLVVYTGADGELRFDHVTRDGDTLTATSTQPARGITGGGTPLSSPAAWAEFVPEDRMGVLGVAYRRGCPDDSRVLVDFVDLDASSGAIRAMPRAGPFQVGETRSESDPAIAWNEERKTWLVTWRDAAGFRARVVDGDPKRLRGDAPYTIIPQGGGVGVTLSTAAVPLSGAWFGALAAVSRDGAFGFDVARLGVCAK